MSAVRALIVAALLQLGHAQLEYRGTSYCELWCAQPDPSAPNVSVVLTILLTGNPLAQCNEAAYAATTIDQVTALPPFANVDFVFKNGPREWIYDELINPQQDPPLPVFTINGVNYIPVAQSVLPRAQFNAAISGAFKYLPNPVTRAGTALWDDGKTQFRIVDSNTGNLWQMQALSKIEGFAPENPGLDTLESLGEQLDDLPPGFSYEVLRGVPGISIPPGPTFVIQDKFFNTYVSIVDDTPDCTCKKLKKRKHGIDHYDLDFACQPIKDSEGPKGLLRKRKKKRCKPLLDVDEEGLCETGFEVCRIRTPLKCK